MQGIRHHKESFFHTRFWIVVLAIICILLGISVVKIYLKYAHAKSIRNDYQEELTQVKQHETDLQKNIDALSTERGKEEEIRDRYRVVKQGEQMILIVNDDKKEIIKEEIENQKEKGFFGNIWSKIVHLFN
jgi:cell division protein FtsB